MKTNSPKTGVVIRVPAFMWRYPKAANDPQGPKPITPLAVKVRQQGGQGRA